MQQHYLVCGMGHLGHHVVELLRRLGENDAVNLSVGLGARQANPRLRAVIRLFDADFARKVQSSLNVDMALSSSLIAAPSFVSSTLYPDVQAAFTLREQLLTVRRRRVEGSWTGRTKNVS